MQELQALVNSRHVIFEIKENFLYLGSGRMASEMEALKSKNITHILNVADDVPNFHPDSFIYCNLSVGDFGTDAGISRVFGTAHEFITNARDASPTNRIFVHCAAGVNRSVTVVIAMLMLLDKLTLKEAWAIVRSKRKSACPLSDNIRELIKFEEKLYQTTTLTAETFYKPF